MQLDMLSFVDTRIWLLLAVTSYLATGQRKCFPLVCGGVVAGVAVRLCALGFVPTPAPRKALQGVAASRAVQTRS